MSVRSLKVVGPLVAVLLFVPVITHASIPFWGPIIPPAATDPLCAAGWGLVVEVINRIIQFSVTVAIAIVAPIMITWAGALLVTSGGSPGARTKAKSMLLSTVVGIMVALSAWLIVNALMAVLYNPAPDPSGRVTWPERWYNLIVMTGASDCIPLKARLDEADYQTGPFQGGANVTVAPPVGTDQYTHAEAWAILQQHGRITISSTGTCYDRTIPTCTSLETIPQDAIARIIDIQIKCHCDIVISGGTEVGHKSHGIGLAVVDFNYSPELITGIRAAGYAINANFGRGATCEPPGQAGVVRSCSSGPIGHIHMEL